MRKKYVFKMAGIKRALFPEKCHCRFSISMVTVCKSATLLITKAALLFTSSTGIEQETNNVKNTAQFFPNNLPLVNYF